MPSRSDLDDLHDASYRRLVVQMYAICGNLSDAQDAVQEAFVTATRRHREFERVVNPEAWIRTVALNRFGPDGGTPRWSSDTRDWVPGPQRAVDVGPERVAIVGAPADLPLDQRQIVVLHHLVRRQAG